MWLIAILFVSRCRLYRLIGWCRVSRINWPCWSSLDPVRSVRSALARVSADCQTWAPIARLSVWRIPGITRLGWWAVVRVLTDDNQRLRSALRPLIGRGLGLRGRLIGGSPVAGLYLCLVDGFSDGY